MPVRRTLRSLLEGPVSRLVEDRVRAIVEASLAARPPAPAPAPDERVAALEAEVAALKKKLSMAMGAIQASTAQLMQAKGSAEEALSAAGQASQHATSARATAEAAADGVTGVEEQIAALLERLGTAPEPPPTRRRKKDRV